MKNTLASLFRYLPLGISRAVNSLPDEILLAANEIRLRRNAPVSVTAGTRNIMFDGKGRVCDIRGALRATDRDIRECLSKLTEGSLYTCDEYIAQGFIPLADGGRAGVCGRANPLGGFSEITSVNLRLHRFLPEIAAPLIRKFRADGIKGTLVCAPPAMGKTTFLRSAAYMLANGIGIAPKRVAIADERCEITAGIEHMGLADAVTSMPKAEAISLLTRTMSPEIIICDEISPSETDALAEAQNTGVCLIASAHCRTPRDILNRGRMKNLVSSGLFPICVLADHNGGYTCTVAETEAFL